MSSGVDYLFFELVSQMLDAKEAGDFLRSPAGETQTFEQRITDSGGRTWLFRRV